MPNFTAGTSFTDGVTNDVTAAKLNALVADAVPTSSLSLNSTTGTIGLFSSGTGTAATPAIQPTGDTNTGIFFPAADTIAFSEGGAEAMRIDSSGNVGIGTSPSRKLDVNGVAGATYLMLTSNTASAPAADAAITRPADGTLGLITNSTERLRIDSSGNVGIGTSSPSGKLHVNGQTYIQGTVSGGLASSTLIANASGQAQFWGLGPDVSTTGSMAFVVSRSNLTSSLQALTIDSNGRVGIGSTSPARQLTLDHASAPEIGFYTSGTERVKLSTGGTAASQFCVDTGGAERLRIDSSGNLLVGTTSGAIHRIVKSSASDFAFQVSNTSSSTPYVQALTFASAAPNDSTSMFLRCDDTGQAGRIQLRSNGGLANYSANNVNLSDERLKQDIQASPSYLDKICSIPVVNFKYKDQTHSDYNLGVIAQRVEAVCPELVDVDGFGETPNDGIPLKSIYQTDLQYALMKCIQELKSENDSLKTRIEALEVA